MSRNSDVVSVFSPCSLVCFDWKAGGVDFVFLIVSYDFFWNISCSYFTDSILTSASQSTSTSTVSSVYSSTICTIRFLLFSVIVVDNMKRFMFLFISFCCPFLISAASLRVQLCLSTSHDTFCQLMQLWHLPEFFATRVDIIWAISFMACMKDVWLWLGIMSFGVVAYLTSSVIF